MSRKDIVSQGDSPRNDEPVADVLQPVPDVKRDNLERASKPTSDGGLDPFDPAALRLTSDIAGGITKSCG
jgi:hypothetical protein